MSNTLTSPTNPNNSRPGYEHLATYMLGKVIQDLTDQFCQRFLNSPKDPNFPNYRQREQMTQAARSNPQNIAEGFTQPSLKGYIKLAGIAHGSNEELTKDFQDFLRQRGLPIWEKEHPQVREFRKFRVVWISPTSLNTPNLPINPTEAANLLLTLCQMEGYLLKRLVESLKEKHRTQGGLTESLYRNRVAYRRDKTSLKSLTALTLGGLGLLGMLTLAPPAHAAYDDLTDGLVGWWQMDDAGVDAEGETITDSSGNDNSGTLAGDNGVGDNGTGMDCTTAGKFGTGCDFDGTDDSISVSNNYSDASTSIAFWFKADSITGANQILVNKYASGTDHWGVRYDAGGNVEIWDNIDDSNSTYYETAVAAGSWHHVVIILHSNFINELYIDGLLIGNNQSSTDNLTSFTGNLYFAQRGNNSAYFGGNLDDVRVYNRALSPREVSQLYNWAPAPNSYWNLDDNTSTIAEDRSGNDNQITFPAITESGYVKSVEYVEITLDTASSETADSVNLSKGQDISNSVPFVTSIVDLDGNTGSADDWTQILVDVYFESGPSRVTVERTNGDSAEVGQTPTIIFGIYVVEFDPTKVAVQQGVLTFTGTSDTDPITAVDDQTKAAMVFYYNTSQSTDIDSYARASVAGWFSADDTLSWQRDVSDGTITGHYYVFEAQNSEFSVQASTFSIGSGTSSNTATINEIDMSKSFVIGSYRTSEDGDNSNDGSVSIYLNSATQVGAARSGTAENISDIRTFVVTFAGSESVLRGTFSYAADDGQETATISEVDLDYAMAWNPNTKQGNMLNNGSGSGDVQESFQKLEVTDSTTVQGDRRVGGSTASGRWEVIDFGAPTETDPQPAWTPGKYGSGLDFDGTDDYLQTDSTELKTADNFTVMAWFRTNDTNTVQHILWQGDVAGNGGGDQDEMGLTICETTASCADELQFFLEGTAGDDIAITKSNFTDTTNWHHMAGVVTDVNSATATGYLYLDGVLVGTDTANAVSRDNWDTALRIGRPGADERYMNGLIDDVRIYNYARTPAQIIEDMNAGHPLGGSPVGSQVGYWKFDEAQGTTAQDSTDNGNDLTLSAASWTLSGKFGGAWNGTNAAWLSRADDDDFDFTATEDFAISGWFKSDSATNPAATEYLVNKASATVAGYAVYANTSGFLCFGIDDDTSWEPDIASCTSTDVYDATWHHFAAIRDYAATDKTYIYIDGIQRDNDSDTTTATLANSLSLYIGDRDGTDNGDEFAGDLDELKIYRAALTPEQILIDYNHGKTAVLGSTGTTSAGVADSSQAREFCVPGDTSTCDPPVGWWKMDENTGTTSTFDSSGNGNTGTMGGTMTESDWVSGKFGSALDFDGTDDYVAISHDTLFDFGDGVTDQPFTLSAWVNMDDASLFRIIEKIDDTDPGTAPDGWALYTTATDFIIFAMYDGSYDDEINTISASAIMTAYEDQWVHLQLTYDGSESSSGLTMYVNGLPIPQTRTDEGTYNGFDDKGDPIHIGRINFGATYTYANGQIDDVRVYDYARTPAQVAWDFNRGAPIGWWKLDECTGSGAGAAKDSSKDGNGDTNGNTGTITIGASGSNTSAGDCDSGDTSEAWNNGTTGKRNASLDFDGVDDEVDVGDIAEFDFGANRDFTISAWVNTTQAAEASNWPQIVGKEGDSPRYGYLMNLHNGANAGWYAQIYENDTNSNTIDEGVIDVADGEWHHLVMMRNGSSLITYTDGQFTAEDTSTNTGDISNGQNLMIGSDTWAGSEYEGQIDDVRIYNYALTVAQVKIVMNDGAARFGD